MLEHSHRSKISTHEFWKCVSYFMKHVSYAVYLEVIGTDVVKAAAEVFAKPFQCVYKTSFPVGYRSAVLSRDFLLLLPISELDILKALKCLKPSKSVRLFGMPGFIIRGYSTNLYSFIYCANKCIQKLKNQTFEKVINSLSRHFWMCITCKSLNIVNEHYKSYIQQMKFSER